MDRYETAHLEHARGVVSATIKNCEKIQPKFAEGTSQHTLLKNRIKALCISEALMRDQDIKDQYTKEEIVAALAPIQSIIHKCEKAGQKFAEGTAHYNRMDNLIEAMSMAKALLTSEGDTRK